MKNVIKCKLVLIFLLLFGIISAQSEYSSMTDKKGNNLVVQMDLQKGTVHRIYGLKTNISEYKFDIRILTKVKGVGIWTSKMFLIFVLARPNVFPTEDTSFKNTIKKIYNLDEKDFNKKANLIKEKWHPYESIASWYIWAFQNEDINVKA